MGQAATSEKALSEYDDWAKTHQSSPQTKAWANKLTAEGKMIGRKTKQRKAKGKKKNSKKAS